MTRREAITTKVLSYLQGITIVNGYLTNLGNSMELWRVKVVPASGSIAGTLRDVSNQQSSGPHMEILHYEIEVGVKTADANQYGDLCDAIRDIDKALTDATNVSDLITTFNSPVEWYAEGEDLIEFELESNSKTGKALINRYLVHRHTNNFNPDLSNSY